MCPRGSGGAQFRVHPLVSYDLIKRRRPATSEKSLVRAGRFTAFITVILAVVSWIKPHRHTPESSTLYRPNPLDAVRAPGWPGLGDYRFIAALLFVTMVLLYWIFS